MKNKILIINRVVILAVIYFASITQSATVLYPPPSGLTPSNQYEVQVYDGNNWVDSYVNFDVARTTGAGSGDEPGKTFSWTTFETSDPAAVRVRRIDGGFGNIVIRPLRYNISSVAISSDTVEFLLQPGQKVSVEFDTEIKSNCYDGTNGVPCIKDIMMVFADPLKTTSAIDGVPSSEIYNVPTGSHEIMMPVPGTTPAGKSTLGDCNGKSVVVFGPGVYDIGYWQVPNSIDHIHFEGGAVVFGAIDVIPQGYAPFYDASTISTVYRNAWQSQTLRSSFRITGPGVLSSAKLPWHLKKDFTYTAGDDWWAHVKVLQLAVADITLEDITLANSPHWVLALINDYDNRSHGIMDNFKIVGAWTYNNDGTPNLGTGGAIRNAFIHADDDAFKIYNSDSTIDNCVVWQSNNGAVFQHGWFPKTNSNVDVTNIDIIHFEAWYGGSYNRAVFNYAHSGGNGLIDDITFTNINIEGKILRLFGFNCGSQQQIRDFTFTNMYCDGMGVGWPGSLGNNYFSGNISNFHFNNFFFDGAPVMSGDDALFEFSNGANGSSFTYGSLTLFFLLQPQPAIAMEGESAQFTVSVYSELQETYQWYKKDGASDILLNNGSKYSDVDSATLTIANCQNSDETSYFCVVDNADSDPLSSNLAALVVAQGLVGHWPMDGNLNEVINGNNGTATGTVSYATGADGEANSAISVTASDYVSSQAAIDVDGSEPRTLSFWFKAAEQAESAVSYGSRSSDGGLFEVLLDYPDGGYCGHFWGWLMDTDVTGSGTQPSVSWNTWTMATMTYDGTTVKLYQNDTLKRTATLALDTTSTKIYIGGGNNNGVSGYYDDYVGYIDDVRVYDYALDASEVTTLYSQMQGIYVCNNPLITDFTDDCVVDLADLFILMQSWLDCGRWPVSTCP